MTRWDGRLRTILVKRSGRGWELETRGARHLAQVLSPHVAELSKHMLDKVPPDLSRFLLAPMPGLLTRLDVKQGDSVCMLMRNDIAFIEAAYAAMRLGAYGVPVNWHFKPEEINYVLKDSGTSVLIAHADMLPLLHDTGCLFVTSAVEAVSTSPP